MSLERLVIKVGCCGFPISRRKYYELFRLVELQNTFYNLPTISWAEKLANEVPEDFTITMKAWQVITHPSKSPTWRRLKKEPPGDKLSYGWLKPTKENFRAWEKTVEIANALRAKVMVVQTPSSLPYTEESIRWIDEFFKQAISILDNDIIIGWEPRGEWTSDRALMDLRRILTENNITHIIDLFRRTPVYIYKVLYVRLHGIGKGEVNYRYKYTDDDLRLLLEKLYKIDYPVNYVLFNNVYMLDDAKRFIKIIRTL